MESIITLPNTSCFDIKKISESGQCFRINKIDNNLYSVISFGRYLEIKQENDNLYLSCSYEEYHEIWIKYFDIICAIENESYLEHMSRYDSFLKVSFEYGKGITILRQDMFEIIISLIISKEKSISSTKECIEKLCSKFGMCIIGDKLNPVDEFDYAIVYTFPSATRLSRASIEELKECGLGYRAEYVKSAAEWWLKNMYLEWESMSYHECLSSLVNIKGVGSKIANYICLFGLHQLEACAIDTHMKQIIKSIYNNVAPRWMSSNKSGLIQQYVFYYKINMKGIINMSKTESKSSVVAKCKTCQFYDKENDKCTVSEKEKCGENITECNNYLISDKLIHF